MPGFEYGGGNVGDGTGWSSERGQEPKQNGEQEGNSGNNSGSGGNTSGSSSASRAQISAIQNDLIVRQKLLNIIRAAVSINAAAKITIASISAKGTLSVVVNGINTTQARQIGLTGLVMGITSTISIGDLETGHALVGNYSPDAVIKGNDSTLDILLGNKGPDGQSLSLNNGQMGYWVSETRSTAEHEVTTKRFVAVGPSEAEKAAAAAKDAQDKLQAESAAKAKAEQAAAEARITEAQRQQAIAEAALVGKNQSVPQAQNNLNKAISEASQLQTAATVSAQQAAQKRTAAVSAEAAAVQAQNTWHVIQNKLAVKAPNGKGYTTKNGMFGYIIKDSRDTAEHTVYFDRFISIGISVAQRDAARDEATNTRNTANQLASDALAAEQQSAAAAVAARDAETRRQAALAALSAAQQAAAEAEQKRIEAEKAAALAEEQRLKADAEARAAEEARIAAENAKRMQEREAAAGKLKSTDVQSARGIPASASMASFPLSWAVASAGGVALGEKVTGAVWARLTAALAELRGIAAASLAGPVSVAILGLLYSEKVGAGSDIVPGRDISALMPGDVLSLPDNTTLNTAADFNTPVSMPVRGRLVVRDEDTLETELVRTPTEGSVPVVRAVLDKETGYWGYTLPAMPGIPAQTILVSPSDAPGINSPLGLSGPVPLPETILHTGADVSVPDSLTVTTTPVADDLDFNDLILIFPAESGLKPLYIMYRSRRNMPGTVSGKGQEVGDNWLGNAGTDQGAPVPGQIADKLRGRTFGSFDAFRRAFWTEVAQDMELSKQFNPGSRSAMNKGFAPAVRKSERVGGRIKMEIHHQQLISNDGAVYNVENMRIMTPKRHIEIHKDEQNGR